MNFWTRRAPILLVCAAALLAVGGCPVNPLLDSAAGEGAGESPALPGSREGEGNDAPVPPHSESPSAGADDDAPEDDSEDVPADAGAPPASPPIADDEPDDSGSADDDASGGLRQASWFVGELDCNLYFELSDPDQFDTADNTARIGVSIRFDDEGYPKSVVVPGFMYGQDLVAEIGRDGQSTTVHAQDELYNSTVGVHVLDAVFDDAGGEQTLDIDFYSAIESGTFEGDADERIRTTFQSANSIRYEVSTTYDVRMFVNNGQTRIVETIHCAGILYAQ